MSELKLTISARNKKLGAVPNFSLPPFSTCPGATKACKSVCYANKGTSKAFAQKHWTKNLKMIKKNLTELWQVNAYLKKNRPQLFRIHVSGDFAWTSYTKAWIRIVKSNPKVTFWAYTRSWRLKKLMKDLQTLHDLPNMILWASCDKFTGNDTPADWKVAYMSLDDQDMPVPEKTDLLFRVNHKTELKKFKGVAVCPPENGTEKGGKLTCAQCGICFRT